jgi:hypothetical protein
MKGNNAVMLKEIDDRWNHRLSAIMRNSPMETPDISIVVDRQPDVFLLPRLRSRRARFAGLFLGNELGGFAMMLEKNVFVRGMEKTAFYFGSLYVEPWARGNGFLSLLPDFFFSGLPESDIIGYAAAMRDNKAAQRWIGEGRSTRLPGLHVKAVGQWRVSTILAAFPSRQKLPFSIRRARPEDLGAVAGLFLEENSRRLFYPSVSQETIAEDMAKLPDFGADNYYLAERERKIVGVCCAWDMTRIKRNLVLRYGRRLRKARWLYQAFGSWLGLPGLPAEGQPFRDVTITDYAVRDGDPDILRALLLFIFQEIRRKKYHLLVFGCEAGDPLSTAAGSFLRLSYLLDVIAFSKSKALLDELGKNERSWLDMALL